MPSLLVKPELELCPLSLLALADLGQCPKGRRRFDRLQTLFSGTSSHARPDTVPAPVTALEKAGLVEVRRSSARRGEAQEPGWSADITDKGLALHRALMAALRNAGALTAQ